MNRITTIELPVIYKVTNLIEPEILDLLLKGLSEEGRALVVEEMENSEINRIPLSKNILKSYWSPLCGYLHKFSISKEECRNSTKRLAYSIFKGEANPGRHQCYLGLEVFSIPFRFQGKMIGVLFGGKYKTKGSNIEEKVEVFFNRYIEELRKEGVSLLKAKKYISKIKEVSEEEIKDVINSLTEASSQIIALGLRNYQLKKNLIYQNFRTEIMKYFFKKIYSNKKIETIFQKILEEINYLFQIRYSILRLIHKGEEMIISTPKLSLTSEVLNFLIEKEIMRNFKRKQDIHNIYWWNKKEGRKRLTSIRNKLGLDANLLLDSTYAISFNFGDESRGFLIFIDSNIGEDDSDFCEFITILADIFTTQINLWIAGKEKFDFIAEMVHRLKAPMQFLLDEAYDLERKFERNDELMTSIQRIKYGVSLLDSQTKGYSLITAKEKYYSIKQAPIHSLIRECIQKFEPLAKNRMVNVYLDDIKGKIEMIGMDKQMMEVALSNLIDNAIKYSIPDSYILIRIAFNDREKECHISITNKGYEIRNDEMERIFERFYRGMAVSRERFVPGTGIGLAVVKEVIEEIHKGKVEVESISRDGGISINTFHLYIPYHVVPKIL